MTTDPAAAAAGAAAAEAAARGSYGRLIALLVSRTRDIAAAEDALSEAFAAALADWPARGVPRSPDAWLLTVARRRLVDAARRRQLDVAATQSLAVLAELDAVAAAVVGSGQGLAGGSGLMAPDGELPDRRLALLLACAHPALDRSVHAPLMLQVVLGFDAAAIASAFLVAPSTMGQRLSRAKARIRDAGIRLEIPGAEALPARLDAVLDAIYATYAEGWVDPTGSDPRRRNLSEEAIWLGRLVAELQPGSGEALGLLALMLHAHARRAARRNDAGDYVPLAEQDPARWDGALIDEADAWLDRANRCAGSGRFQLEAAIQSAHAVRRSTGVVDRAAIDDLYGALLALTGSPVVALNRAVARFNHAGSGQRPGAAAALLGALDALADDPRMRDYQPYWAARAQALAGAGRSMEAGDAFHRAIGLERDPAVRRHLQRRAAGIAAARADQPGTEDSRRAVSIDARSAAKNAFSGIGLPK